MAVGDVIHERYRLLREIGDGGMAVVYEAEHVVTGQRVAVKVFHDHVLRSSAAKQRFLTEAQAPAKIGHPALCRVFDAGVSRGVAFVAMELLTGETLESRLCRGMPIENAIAQLVEVLEGLAVAHERGFVHRDFKPENVFVVQGEDGEHAKLLDFGIAHDDEAPVTQTGRAMGTPGYMAPEQVMDSKRVSPASDVWSVGVTLYRIVSGHLPFGGNTAHAAMVHACTVPHVPLQGLVPDADPALSELVDRCLAKDPSLRPPNAHALIRELAGARATTPLWARTTTSIRPLPDVGVAATEVQPTIPTTAEGWGDAPPETSRGTMVLAATITALVVLGGGVAGWALVWDAQDDGEAQATTGRSADPETASPSALPVDLDDPQRTFARGMRYLSEHEFTRARGELQAAVDRLGPNSDAAYYLAAASIWAGASLSEVDLLIGEALSADGLTPARRSALEGLRHINQARYVEATGPLSAAVELTPNDLGARSGLFEAYFHSGQIDAALEQFAVIHRMDPTFHVGIQHVFEVMAVRGQGREMTEYLATIDEASPHAAWRLLQPTVMGEPARTLAMLETQIVAQSESHTRREHLLELRILALGVVRGPEAAIAALPTSQPTSRFGQLAWTLSFAVGDTANADARRDEIVAALPAIDPRVRIHFLTHVALMAAMEGRAEVLSAIEDLKRDLERQAGFTRTPSLLVAGVHLAAGRGDTATLESLAQDPHPEVRAVATAFLAESRGDMASAVQRWEEALAACGAPMPYHAAQFRLALAAQRAGDQARAERACRWVLRPTYVTPAWGLTYAPCRRLLDQ